MIPAGVMFLAFMAQAVSTPAQEPPRGEIVERVTCQSDASQSYALYLPSSYTADRAFPVLIGFHPAARGRAIVEAYRAAADTHGYIVAASNNSRNGPWDVSLAAARAMLEDIGRRFNVDAKRVYLTGHSGGARVALGIALSTTGVVAGVIASSAGYPDSTPRKSLPFVVFGTAGTEDFNYLELRELDRDLTTPHRVAIFDGGHTLPPAPVALDAVEWLELHAMRSGIRARDEQLLDRLFAKRQAAISSSTDAALTTRLLRNLVDDFKDLRDVSSAAVRVDELGKQQSVRNALARERSDDDAERRALNEVFTLEAELMEDRSRLTSLARLRETLTRWRKLADSADDSPERRRARRSLRAVLAGAAERVQDREYLQLLARLR